MNKIAAVLAALYGLVSLTGGVIGFVKANSKASLIAGGASGLLLLVGAFLITKKPTAGLILALVVSVGLVGRFAQVTVKAGALSAIAGVMIGGGLVVVVASVMALLQRDKGVVA